MSDASESVLVGTRYTNWKSGTRNVFEDHETEYSNKYVKKNSQNTTNSSGAGMRRTYSCPLFVLLKQDALEGKKVRLGRGALEYLRNRQERSLSRSFSQSDLATIKEVEEELEDSTTTENSRQVVRDGQENSYYYQNVLPNATNKFGECVKISDETRKDMIEKAAKMNSNGSCRVSRRTFEKLVKDYSKRKIMNDSSQLPPLPRTRNMSHELSAGRNTLSEQQKGKNVDSHCRSSTACLEPDYYSMYHGVFVSQPSNSFNESGPNVSLERKEDNGDISNHMERSISSGSSSLLNPSGSVDHEYENMFSRVEDKVYFGRTLWEPPRVWKIPEHHLWTGHDVRTNEHGGWWTERWGCSLDNVYRFGDKYGVDNDGSAWAEWWLERDLDIQEGGTTMFVKEGKRWGCNQKNESWMESWHMTADGTYYTEFQMIPPNEFLSL